MHALVIGGSMSGLFAGLLLRRAGVSAAIYERTEIELIGRGAGIVTQPELKAVLVNAGCDLRDLGVEVARRRTLDRSGYVLGASNASFLLVLAVHHEVQYLYFTYAIARRSGNLHGMEKLGLDFVTEENDSKASVNAGRVLRSEAKFAASFVQWPVIAFIGAMAGGWFAIPWLAPLGVGGLFCHYWLDGRIWNRRSFQN